MEASIGMHYNVIVSVTAVIFCLLLTVFVTVFCSHCTKKDRDHEPPESLDASERQPQPLLDSTPINQTESRGKRVNESQRDKLENRVVTGSEHSASASVNLNLDQGNTPDVSSKSHTTEKVSHGQDGEPVHSIRIQPNSTIVHYKQQNSSDANSRDLVSTTTNVQANLKDKVRSQSQYGSTGAHHHNSGKEMAINQAKDEVTSKVVASSKALPSTRYSEDYQLTANDIREVREKIWEARVKWYDIGIEVGCKIHDLDAIKANNHDVEACFSNMLTIWLRKSGATWEALANALRSDPVGYPQLAESITSNALVYALSDASYETIVSDCTSKGVMGFSCGCPTPCNLIDHLNGKCLKLFPYLDFSKLTYKEQSDLEAKLCAETSAIIIKFANLTKCIRKSLVDQHLDPKEIVSSILGIAPSRPSTCPILETLNVGSITSIYDVIIHLQQNSYISFFNYHIVEYLINEYGTDEDKAELDKYITHFQDFCRRSIFEVPQRIHGRPPKESTQLAIKVISKNQWSGSRFSLGDAKNVQIKVAEELGLQNCVSLPLYKTSEGCVMLIFALPKVIMELVKPKLGSDGMPSSINICTDKYTIQILCGPPGKPFLANVTSDSVSLQWTKPDYVGTLSLMHYVVYYRSHLDHWEKEKTSTKSNGLTESVTVEGLSREGAAAFVFKVEAVSKLGITVEGRESDPIQLSTPLSEPKFRLDLDWKKKAKMPFGISIYPQVAVLKEKVYIGGGNTSSDTERHTVLVYDPQKDTYDTLPPYTHKYFAMAAIGDNLVLIGGEQDDKLKPRFTNQLGVWDSRSLKWTHPLPPMSTPCKSPSVTAYKNKWLFVIGGYNNPDGELSRVEILDTSSQQWFNSAPMLAPCHQVSLATIGNMCYLMGGLINITFSKRVYAARIDHLISQNSAALSIQSPWSMLPDTPGTQATALALNGALLAVGGIGADIYMYQPSKKCWGNIGRLRIERAACACVVLPNCGGVLVAGGGETKVVGGTGTIDHSHNTDQKLDIGTPK